MQKSVFIVIGFIGFLAGCTTVTPEQRRAADEQACRGYGFKQGSEAFANCLLKLDLDRRADRRAWDTQVELQRRPMILYQPVYIREPRK